MGQRQGIWKFFYAASDVKSNQVFESALIWQMKESNRRERKGFAKVAGRVDLKSGRHQGFQGEGDFPRMPRFAMTIAKLAALVACLCACAAAQTYLAISDDPLPPLTTGMQYHAQLRATGIAPPFVWSVVEGDLPDGINLSADGVLSGRPIKAGPYNFTVKVEDSGHPSRVVTKAYSPSVGEALLLSWLEPPKVHDDRIDGSVQVSNGSHDTFDLTVVIVAVATLDQRATTLGYEHFDLKPGASNIPVKFGLSLPNGGYVVHVDAAAEIPAKNSILRQRLQTGGPLQVAVGP